ncbi:hypothetical protein [Methylobacterium pseudosasicola]|uniref:HTH araC/xylS-type domain-containing protein n=1 Tax=Methylobacterium pseudosasicola TaxID=582667 RepID=A0A1I4HV08_9HYPH|nr:hypothetical protein [Methylobacterium pseudosasicola]SFL45982.1 hypothetical protein SAMN05192568_100575 [Methylobacterium pseudosasicola]
MAYAVGYGSPKMFSKTFAARYGVNPRDVDNGFAIGARRESGDTVLSWIAEL